ncbi:DUF2634 domain-containing protein [Lysinibacillus xylanilyticus]|uniref:DUF2634 domain-containing protein n=1 Tax=Lysinibacillus xylanilyticus TaxID=582475 RepID=UPI003D042F1F
MIPNQSLNDRLVIDFEEEVQPTRTYRMDHVRKRIVGYTDGNEAMEQAIYKAMGTERYENIIYSWNFGAEIAKLFGKPIPYVYSELQRITKECLLIDNRINELSDFNFSHKKNKVFMSFTAHTVYGEIPIEREVDI